MISLPDDLLTRVDREARRRGSTRSALLQAAALRELGSPDPETVDAALARARAALAGAGPLEAADAVRADRDGRHARDRRRL